MTSRHPRIRPARRVLTDVWWGTRWGLVFAVLFVLWVSLLGLGDLQVFQKEISLGVLAFYVVAGVIGGAALGSLRPNISRRDGLSATWVGMAALFLYKGVRIMEHWLRPDGKTWAFVFAYGILVPLVTASRMWRPERVTKKSANADATKNDGH